MIEKCNFRSLQCRARGSRPVARFDGDTMTRDRTRVTCVADITITAATCYLLALCGVLAYRHGWDAKYGFVALGGLLCFSLRWMRPAARVSAALFIVSSAVALTAANLFLGLRVQMDREFPRSHWLEIRTGAKHLPVLAEAAQRLGIPYDRRTRLEVIRDLSLDGTEAWPATTAPLLFAGWPTDYREPVIRVNGMPLLPLGGISNARTVYCNETGSYTVYDSGSHGFANPPGAWSRDTIDVAVVGDSFVHGACVPPGQSFPSLIRQRFPGTLNLGNDGIGPLTELAIVKEYLPVARPNTVVWTYFEQNDFSDLRKEKDSFIARYLEPAFSQNLIHRQAQIDNALKGFVQDVLAGGSLRTTVQSLLASVDYYASSASIWERLIKFSFLWDTMWTLMTWAQAPPSAVPVSGQWVPQPEASEQEWDLLRHALGQTLTLVRSWGGKLVFVYLPQYERYARPDFRDLNRDRLLAMVTSMGVPVIDIHQVFESHNDALTLFPFRQPAHYTPEGYRLVADAIIRHLEP